MYNLLQLVTYKPFGLGIENRGRIVNTSFTNALDWLESSNV